MWFDFLWYSLYCGGLGASLQYLWSMSINCKVTTMVSLLTIRHHTKLIQYCWLYSPGCTLHLYDLFILELKVCALGSWSPSAFCSPKPLSLWQPPIFSLYLRGSFVSLSIMPFSSKHVVATGNISFFYMGNIDNISLCVYIHTPHFLYPFIHWWALKLLHVLTYK